jgi:hypothetical protein
LTILALIEAIVGMFVLVTVSRMLISHAGGLVTAFLPTLTAALLLLAAGAAIFLRRPWSYYLHIAVILLAGAVLALNVGTLVEIDITTGRMVIAVVTVSVTTVFLMPPVRRYFGL